MRTAADFALEAELLPDGVEKGRLLERAAELAELDGDRVMAFTYRYEMLNATMDCGHDAKLIGVFSWMLQAFEKEPEKLGDQESNIMWLYKWALGAALSISSVPLLKLRALFEDYERRVRDTGRSLYTVHDYRRWMEYDTGNPEKAAFHMQEMSKHPRDSHADCLACVSRGIASYYLDLGKPKRGLQALATVISGQDACAHVPLTTWPLLSVLSLLSEDDNHTRFYANAWEETLGACELTSSLHYHIHYMSRRGLAADFAHFLKIHSQPTFLGVSESHLLSSWREVDAALIRFKPHLSDLPFSGPMRVSQTETVNNWTDLAAHARRESDAGNARYDARNGNSFFTQCHHQLRQEAKTWQRQAVDMQLTPAARRIHEVSPSEQTAELPTFATFAREQLESIDPVAEWDQQAPALAGKPPGELLLILQESEDERVSYAALQELKHQHGNTTECAIGTANLLYGEPWRDYLARCLLHYRDDADALDLLLPELLKWPSDRTDYALRRLVDLTTGARRSKYIMLTARQAARANRYEEAIQLAQTAAQQPPAQSADKLQLAILLNHLYQQDISLPLLHALTEDRDASIAGLATLHRGYAYKQQESYEEAERDLLAYLDQADEPTPYANMHLAFVLRVLGRADEAVPHAEHARTETPWDTDAISEYAYCLLANGDPQAALDQFRQAYELHPDEYHLIENYAVALRNAGACKEAIPLLRKCRNLIYESDRGDLNGIIFSLAMCRLASGPSPQGRKEMRSLILTLNRYSEEALDILGNEMADRDGPAAWSRSLARMQSANPDNPLLAHARGAMLLEAGKLRQAEEVLALHVGDENCVQAYVAAISRRHGIAAALEALPLARVAQNPSGLLLRWRLQMTQQLWEGAQETLNQSRELMGDIPVVQVAQIDLQIAQKQFEPADAGLAALCEQMPDERSLLQRRTITLGALGRTENLANIEARLAALEALASEESS